MAATEPTTAAPAEVHPGTVEHLDDLPFTNRFTRELPADPEVSPRRRQVQGAAFSRQEPTPVSAPRTLAVSTEVADLLGLSAEVVASQDFADVFAGNRLPTGADPFAMAYAGHQFGNWAGQLGDGRAIALGEVLDARGGHQTLQLKGAGPTPYSRTADGRAVLRSSLREFLCSEAMFHLGIPTTRALSLVLTGDPVVRDMLYDGNPEPEPGAVVCRVAPSFTRFGNFQLPASRGETDLLEQLVRFTVRNDVPELLHDQDGAERTLAGQTVALFEHACRSSAELVVDWMRVGFVHGVLNTDNCSILGLTIDYGPYGWLESYDPMWTPNTTDAQGRRYRYGAQPQVIHWNLLQLANALLPLVGEPEPLQEALDAYGDHFLTTYREMNARRLGWGSWQGDADDEAVNALVSLLQQTEVDYVLFHRDLAKVSVDPEVSDDDLLAPLAEAFYASEDLVDEIRAGFVAWLRTWAARVRDGGIVDDAERRAVMDGLNPRFVARNWLASEAIEAAEAGDLEPLHTLLDVLRRPYDEQSGREHHASRRPEWARTKVGCSMLSCSS